MRIGFDWPIDRSLAAVAGKFSATPELVWQEFGFGVPQATGAAVISRWCGSFASQVGDGATYPFELGIDGLKRGRSSLAEAETSHKIYESRIAPQWIKLRTDQHDWLKASLVGLLEPVHCLVISAETHIDQGNVGIEGSVVVLQLR